MVEGQIFFGGELVGKPLVLPNLNLQLAQQEPLTAREKLPIERYERYHSSGHEPVLLPVLSVLPTLSLPLTARERPGDFAATVSGYSARVNDASKFRKFSPRRLRSNTGNLSSQSSNFSPGTIVSNVHDSSPNRLAVASTSVRPGTDERRSGRIAATDYTSLPKLYSSICKDDVQVASEMLDFTGRLAAEHRKECRSEAIEKGRRNAKKWFRHRQQRLRREQVIAREQEELDERRREQAEAEAKLVADCRWKKAFERIKTRSSDQIDEDPPMRIGRGNTLASLTRGNTLASLTSGGSLKGSGASSPMGFEEEEEEHAPKEEPISICKIAKSLTWRVKEVPLDIHIEFLRKLRKLKNRASRFTQTYEARKMRYARLPYDERNLCENAFSQFGADPFTKSLDLPTVRDCLYEVGARGISLQEQLAVFKICEEAIGQADKVARALVHNLEQNQSEHGGDFSQEARMSAARGGINLYTFAVVLLPAVRKSLQALREERVEDEFGVIDAVGSGYIGFQSCLEIVRSVTRADVHYDIIESRGKELLDEFELKEKERRASQDTSDDSIIEQMRKMREAKREAEEKSRRQTALNVELTKTLVLEFATSEQREACSRERQIQVDHEIERETFRIMRYDLPLLHMLYSNIHSDLRPLSRDECAKVFREFGMPTGVCRHHVGSGGIDFDDLLHLVEQIRIDVESDAFNYLREQFDEYPGCNHATKRLPAMEVEDFLRSVRMTGRTQTEKDGLARSLEHVFATYCHEEDTFSFEQVRRVLQRMQEYVRREQHLEEVKVARSCGFQEMELEELHDTFVMLDSDNSGTIELEEAWSAIKSFGFVMSKAAVRGSFAQIGDRDTGTLDFVQFLKLLESMRSREGDICDRKVGKLSDLLKPEMLHLFALLQISYESESEDYDEKTCLQKLSDIFHIPPADSLEKKFHVRTFNELCARAKEFRSES